MNYIATFFSHFGAIRFKRELAALGIKAKVMPVPRSLSSSCGTCVSFSADDYKYSGTSDEIEKIVYSSDDGYVEIFRAQDI